MHKSYIKLEDLPSLPMNEKMPKKISINKEDLSVIKGIFPTFFTDASVYEYWSDNKLGVLNEIPVYDEVNAMHSATLYW